jgi:DNA-binding transcriptional regulator YhcF (GntR family)
VIEFHLDGHSGVPPYQQLVQQVRQALRMGLLSEEDQLPTVHEVARALAINPNTVLKAYRALEYERLVEGRPGQGTFVVGTVDGPPPKSFSKLQPDLVRWLNSARAAGLDEQTVIAFVQATLRAQAEARVA